MSGGVDWMPNRISTTKENEKIEVFKMRLC